MKKDKYFRERGGTAKIINVSCASCEKLIFVYQKDGPGWLKRCYFNRIIEPKEYAQMQKDKSIIKGYQISKKANETIKQLEKVEKRGRYKAQY